MIIINYRSRIYSNLFVTSLRRIAFFVASTAFATMNLLILASEVFFFSFLAVR